MLILGLNVLHADASAALISDGELVAAAEEERFTRIKHASGIPHEAMRWVLHEAGLPANAVEHVAVSRDPHAHKARRVGRGLAQALRTREFVANRLSARQRVLSLGDELRSIDGGLGPDASFHYVEHHPAHIASAFFASDFEEAAVCSVDGLGDLVSMAWGVGRGNSFTLADRVFFPHSLGFFYTAITQLLGFPQYGDEYKVMGLAPYGRPRYLAEMRRILLTTRRAFRLNRRYFRHSKESVEFDFDGGPPVIGQLFGPEMETLLGPARSNDEPLDDHHRDIAASAQARLEEVLLPILARLRRSTGMRSLAIAGGVALNVTANNKIDEMAGFEDVYIQAAASDAGTSLGAALHVAHQTLGRPRALSMDHAYYGPSYSPAACAQALDHAGLVYETLDEETLCRRTAELIAEGKIVGWFQGRMEFGPRALGNRSIVCDPRNPQMKDILNSRTKRREGFRPFAPSVLAERASEIFEVDGASPFMLLAPTVRADWRQRIPSVTHVDSTARIQTVHKETNQRYWSLLQAFDELTGVPLVLNTSFNENEPIVMSPEHAIACYLRADMDVLALENHLVTRR